MNCGLSIIVRKFRPTSRKKNMFAKIEYAVMCVMGAFLTTMETLCEVWQRFKEYDEMRARGYTLMKNDNGDDFWVGYGD